MSVLRAAAHVAEGPEGWMCGTGDDSGKIMDPGEDCWACRESLREIGEEE